MATLFRFEKATLGYPNTILLRSFSWEVSAGEHWIIAGPNGAGKTTLVKTLLGLTPLLAGRLSYYDEQSQRVERPSLGYLPQINQLDRTFPISVGEVIDSGLHGNGACHQGCRERISFLLETIGLAHYEKTPIGELSGGQLQRVLLARALAAEPRLVILDEPTSFLDRAYKASFEALLHQLALPNTTILQVSHELDTNSVFDWQVLPIGG